MKGFALKKAAVDVWKKYFDQVQSLAEERDSDLADYMDEHAESKFRANQEMKKRYTVKIALATKKGNQSEVDELN